GQHIQSDPLRGLSVRQANRRVNDMSLTNLTVHFSNRSDKAVYVTRSLLSRLKLTGTKTLRLSLGKHSIEAPVRVLRRSGNHLVLTPYLRRQLMVPRTGTCYAVKDGSQGIRLGPLIGLMTTSRSPSRS